MQEIIIAIISFTGVIISVTASLVISRGQAKHQIEKMRIELEEAYTGKLFEKRLEVYPSLYSILSGFAKCLHKNQVNKEVINRTLERLDEWDNNYALFLSPLTAHNMYELRRVFQRYQTMDEARVIKNAKKDYIYKVMGLENALKTEIGVFSARDYHKPNESSKTLGEELRKMKQYEEEE